MATNNKLVYLLPLMGLGLLAGCASDSSAPKSTTSLGAQVQMSGAVIDGYLENAKVCLDKNKNYRCDADEPYAMTDAQGKYTLNVDEADKTLYPLVVETTTQTIDKDTNKALTKPYVLSAPADHPSVISPMTSLVQRKLSSNPELTLEQAKDFLATYFKLDPDKKDKIMADFVAGKTSNDPDAQTYALMHSSAKTVTWILGSQMEKVAKLNLTQEQESVVVSLVLSQVFTVLQDIIRTLQQEAANEGFSWTEYAEDVADQFKEYLNEETLIPLIQAELQSALMLSKATIKTPQASLLDVASSSLSLEDDGNSPSSSFTAQWSGDIYANSGKCSYQVYKPILQTASDPLTALKNLDFTSPQLEADSSDCTLEADGSISWMDDEFHAKVSIAQVAEIDLSQVSGSRIIDHLDDYATDALPASFQTPVVFQAGDKAFQLTYLYSKTTFSKLSALCPEDQLADDGSTSCLIDTDNALTDVENLTDWMAAMNGLDETGHADLNYTLSSYGGGFYFVPKGDDFEVFLDVSNDGKTTDDKSFGLAEVAKDAEGIAYVALPFSQDPNATKKTSEARELFYFADVDGEAKLISTTILNRDTVSKDDYRWYNRSALEKVISTAKSLP